MTSRRRRSTLWMPFSEGAATTDIAASATARLALPSIREAEVGREYEGYTVTRIVLGWYAAYATATAGVKEQYVCGIITHQEDIAVGQFDPVTAPSADWMWHEEFTGAVENASLDENQSRDLRSQRKVRGGDSEVFWYITNRSTSKVLRVHRRGRMLVKRA